MIKYDILFGLLLISIILILFMALFIGGMKNKKQIHYAFLSNIVFIFIWSLVRLIQILVQNNYEYVIFLEHLSYIGICLLPISLLYTGIIFAKNHIKLSSKQLLLFIIPIMSLLIVFTNNYHHWFIIKYSFISTEFLYGWYYNIHCLYSYICILIGLYYLIYFSIKNSGFFSKQSILIFLGTIVPLLVVILSTEKIVLMPVFIENISFSFAIICYMFAIFKFNFLNVVPIALQRIVDLISDSYIVINKELEIIDYNKTFIDTFEGILNIKRKDSIINFLEANNPIDIDKNKFIDWINEAVKDKKSISLEKQILSGYFNKYFAIEITPVFSNTDHIGTIILLKDITQHKRDIQQIEQTQKQLMERERLASLGELAGGVAHDINTPLSAVQNNFFQLKSLINETKEGIKEGELNKEDHLEIMQEMEDIILKSEEICKKIANIINSVRNNTRNLSGENIQVFELEYVINDLRILLGHQLKQLGCELVYKEDEKIKLKGDSGKLGQVLTNFIINAMHAYNEKPGTIKVRAQNMPAEIIISVTDFGEGIPEDIKERIFKEMLSTKGAKGTGLGMYISNSIITGNFGGRTWLESEVGKGTTVYIAIPKVIDYKE